MQRRVGPFHFAQVVRRDMRAETHRSCRNDDGARRNRLCFRLNDLAAQFGLIVQPALGNEHRKESEHDRYADHHDGVFAHRQPRRSYSRFVWDKLRAETESFLKFGIRMRRMLNAC